jgi:KaiC/GvpD/RAD55 family RecA-like ATPase
MTARMAKKIERIKSGIPGLDEMMEGGFIKGHTAVLCGSYGTGKTTFCMQFLVSGAMSGDAGLFITFDESPEQLTEEGESFGWDVEGLGSSNKLKIISIPPRDLLNLVEAGFGQISGLMKTMDVKRIAVDSMVMFDLLGKDEYEKRKYALDFVAWLKNHGCTAVLTMESVPSSGEGKFTSVAESIADSIIALYHPQEKKKRTRTIEIIKMRETCHSNDLVDFEITKKGIVVHSEGGTCATDQPPAGKGKQGPPIG